MSMKLKTKLRHLKWFLFGKPDYPPRVLSLKFPIGVSKRAELINYLYTIGISPEDISQRFGITRERVKQLVWKAYCQRYPQVRRWFLSNYYWHYYYRFFKKDVGE